MTPSRRIVLVTATLLLWAGASAAFEASGVRWVDGAFEMQADIVHPSTGSISMSVRSIAGMRYCDDRKLVISPSEI